MKKIKTRLFWQETIKQDEKYIINGNSYHHLFKVLRLRVHDFITIFNETSGEFLAEIQQINKSEAQIFVKEKFKNYKKTNYKLTLCFAPLKTKKIDFLLEKATELGVSAFLPIFTERSSHIFPNTEKMKLKVQEASQQCGRISVPTIYEKLNLTFLVKNGKNSLIIWLDERRNAESVFSLCDEVKGKEIFVILGPEGGFSKAEQEMLESLNAVPVKLANNILRAETAGIAAIACLIGMLI